MLERVAAASVLFTVWPAGVLANFFPNSADEIFFDVDVRDLQGQDRLDVLCAMLRDRSATAQAGAAQPRGLASASDTGVSGG
jgi:hypothetical protein